MILLNYNLGKEGLNAANNLTINNAESIHNIMKIDINWKPQTTPNLITMLADIVKLQLLDLQRSLYNTGNFRLIGLCKKFCIREDIFRAKSPEDQLKYFMNFLKFSLRKYTHVTPSNGLYKLPNKSKDIAKKPGVFVLY